MKTLVGVATCMICMNETVENHRYSSFAFESVEFIVVVPTPIDNYSTVTAGLAIFPHPTTVL